MKNLNEQIQTAADKLSALQAEQAELQGKMIDAVNFVDSASIIKLRHRAADLPVDIFAADVTLKQLRLQRDEEKLPELQTEAQRLSPPIFELQKQVAELQAKLDIAVASQQSAGQDVKDLKERIRDGKFAIESLIRSTQPSTGLPKTFRMNFGG